MQYEFIIQHYEQIRDYSQEIKKKFRANLQSYTKHYRQEEYSLLIIPPKNASLISLITVIYLDTINMKRMTTQLNKKHKPKTSFLNKMISNLLLSRY